MLKMRVKRFGLACVVSIITLTCFVVLHGGQPQVSRLIDPRGNEDEGIGIQYADENSSLDKYKQKSSSLVQLNQKEERRLRSDTEKPRTLQKEDGQPTMTRIVIPEREHVKTKDSPKKGSPPNAWNQNPPRERGDALPVSNSVTLSREKLRVGPTINKEYQKFLSKISPVIDLPHDEYWPTVLKPSDGSFYSSLNLSRYNDEDRKYLQERANVYRDRARAVSAVCRSHPDLAVPTYMNTFTWDLRHDPNLVWCEISKAASTSWMVNFLRLAHYRENDTSLSHLPQEKRDAIRFETHPVNDTLHYRVFRLFPAPDNTLDRARIFTNALRFMIVRHPFTRLLSAYLDKMMTLTPRPPIFNFREMQLDIIKHYRPKNSAKDSEFPTFAEFVQYVIDSTAPLKTLKEWRKVMCWTPYWARCGVCSHDYQLIMKTETLKEDERFLVTLAGLQELKNVSERLHASGSAKNSTDRYFRELSTKQMHQLYGRYELDFQMFGYSIQEYLPLAWDAQPKSFAYEAN